MKHIYHSKGISLIALIITIIVIIILAAIVIFSGLNTPDRANLAKFVQEISDLRLAVQQDFLSKKAEYTINGQTRSDAQIYNIIAKGEDIDMNSPTEPAGYVADLGLNLGGIEYYELTDDRNVKNWNSNKGYAEPRYGAGGTEHHYITDKGEVFILPGYLSEENGDSKYYVSENLFYASNTPIRGAEIVPLSEKYHVGDIVLYTPDSKSYTTNSKGNGGNTGTDPVTLYTSGDTVWKILSINEGTRTVDITAYNGTNTTEKVTLSGFEGYYHGPQELHNICSALYSNSRLGVTARSLTIGELNDACGYTPSYTDGYIYHASQEECDASGDPITINGVTYTHTYTPYDKFVIGNEAIIEGGDEEIYTKNGINYTYKKPVPGNPVYFVRTICLYYPNENGTGRVPEAGDALGTMSIHGWLASPCINVGSEYGNYYISRASSKYITAGGLAYSDGNESSSANGLRPVITLSASLFDGTGDGTTGWNLK